MYGKPVRTVESGAAPFSVVIEKDLRNLRTRTDNIIAAEPFVVIAEVCAVCIVPADQQAVREPLVEPNESCVVLSLRSCFEKVALRIGRIQTWRGCEVVGVASGNY